MLQLRFYREFINETAFNNKFREEREGRGGEGEGGYKIDKR